jgi:osmotically-inducible protein OsmY
MFRTTLLTFTAVALSLLPAGQTRGEYARRTPGRQIMSRAGIGTAGQAMQGVGQFQGTERFVRGNRSARDFVGSDATELRTFVGEQAAEVRGSIRSAVSDLRPEREQNVNVAATKSRGKQMYKPRLAVNFGYRPTAVRDLGSRIAAQLSLTETLDLAQPIEVSVEGATATLRGTVPSEREREMAGLIAQFEPGISSVRNELQVRPTPPLPVPPSPNPPAPAKKGS